MIVSLNPAVLLTAIPFLKLKVENCNSFDFNIPAYLNTFLGIQYTNILECILAFCMKFIKYTYFGIAYELHCIYLIEHMLAFNMKFIPLYKQLICLSNLSSINGSSNGIQRGMMG